MFVWTCCIGNLFNHVVLPFNHGYSNHGLFLAMLFLTLSCQLLHGVVLEDSGALNLLSRFPHCISLHHQISSLGCLISIIVYYSIQALEKYHYTQTVMSHFSQLPVQKHEISSLETSFPDHLGCSKPPPQAGSWLETLGVNPDGRAGRGLVLLGRTFSCGFLTPINFGPICCFCFIFKFCPFCLERILFVPLIGWPVTPLWPWCRFSCLDLSPLGGDQFSDSSS